MFIKTRSLNVKLNLIKHVTYYNNPQLHIPNWVIADHGWKILIKIDSGTLSKTFLNQQGFQTLNIAVLISSGFDNPFRFENFCSCLQRPCFISIQRLKLFCLRSLPLCRTVWLHCFWNAVWITRNKLAQKMWAFWFLAV